MSAKERERLKIFERVKRGELQQKEAAALCQLKYRHLRRLYKRYREQGDRGLVHQGRGRPSNRAHAAEFKVSVLTRYQERYPDFGPTLAAEKLALDGYELDHETLRVWLLKAGLHDLRHTFATRLRAKGVHEMDIMTLLGHTTLQMTSRYTHAMPQNLRTAVDSLNKRPLPFRPRSAPR